MRRQTLLALRTAAKRKDVEIDRHDVRNVIESHVQALDHICDCLCHGQFDDGPSSVSTGVWVCSQVNQGRSRDSIVYNLSHGEGLMPSSYNAPIIYNAATAHLC